MKILYTAEASATGGRDGVSETADKSITHKLVTPKELGGPGGPGTNPEQLFALGYSACFLGAMKYVAGQSKQKLPETTRVGAKVGIGPRDDGKGFGIAVELDVHVPGLSKAEVEDLTSRAHVVCPYSHATHGNISVKTMIV